MHRLLSATGLAILALTVMSSTAMAARIRAEPSGARRATAVEFVISDAFGNIEVNCEVRLDFELSREAEGNLNTLGSIVAGRINRATIRAETCEGGTMRAELFTAGIIYVKEVTNRVRVELWILNARVLIENEGREYRCLYDMLIRATSRENPLRAIDTVLERVLEVRTLTGSAVCPGNGFVVARGTFTLDQAVTMTLT
jgi:hypothetical protein